MANKYTKKQTVMTCRECGTLFLRMPGGGTKYCSEGCRPLRHRRWWKQTNTISFCDHCGDPYVNRSTHPSSRYCSNECSSEARAKMCVCVVCGTKFKQKRNSRGKYCNLSCYRKDQPQVNRELATQRSLEKNQWSPVIWRECKVCGGQLGPRPGNRLFCENCRQTLGNAIGSHSDNVAFLRDRLSGRVCRVCGELFTPYRNDSTVCSDHCNRQTLEYKQSEARARRTDAGKRRKRIENRKRRARKYNNGPVENIDPIEVFDRDKWHCKVCGIYTPKSLRGTCEDRAPELDHIVPLAAGGTHTHDNVQLCCRKCNGEKGATIYQSDLFVGCGQQHNNCG